jgi:FAD/FMN-containing dehydrogenase
MGQFCAGLVAQAHAAAARAAARSALDVLLENSDSESEATPARASRPARNRARGRLRHRRRGGRKPQPGAARCGTCARIPLAQAEEGLNIKHDISCRCRASRLRGASTDALLQREIPGVRLVNFGHLGDGNLHYNVQAPRDQEDRNHWCTTPWQVRRLVLGRARRGRAQDRQARSYQSPVALAMMRAIKQALDPQNLLNPGRVLAMQ